MKKDEEERWREARELSALAIALGSFHNFTRKTRGFRIHYTRQ